MKEHNYGMQSGFIGRNPVESVLCCRSRSLLTVSNEISQKPTAEKVNRWVMQVFKELVFFGRLSMLCLLT